MKSKLLFFFFLIFAQAMNGSDIKISLLTCSPGDAIYSTYGHSAILVEQPSLRKKTVFNYGTFDFNTPNFGVKFIKGELLYQINPDKYRDFIAEYQYDGRGVIQQELDLTEDQKRAVMLFLAENMRPENRTYLYDFFFDNCSTRIRDLFEDVLHIDYPKTAGRQMTYRQLLKPYLSDTPWYHFGTNLILGLPTDDQADYRQEMFLPDYLSKNLEQATLDGHPFLKPAKELLPKTIHTEPSFLNYPIWVMIGILFLAIWVSIKGNAFFRGSFDIILLVAAILSGALFVFMWTQTQHDVCYKNFNLLWGSPLFLLLAIFARKFKAWKWTFFYLIGVIAIWFFLPQNLPIPMFFFTLALLVRTGQRAKFLFT